MQTIDDSCMIFSSFSDLKWNNIQYNRVKRMQNNFWVDKRCWNQACWGHYKK